MWFLLQSTIIFAVMASNIHWHWTTNPYLAGMAGAGLACAVSQAIADWQTLRMCKRLRDKPSRRLRRHDTDFRDRYSCEFRA
jgi:hypothetical protein